MAAVAYRGSPPEGRGSEVGLNVCRLLGDKCLMPVWRGEGHGKRCLLLIDRDRPALGINENDKSRMRRDLRVRDVLVQAAGQQRLFQMNHLRPESRSGNASWLMYHPSLFGE